MIKLPENHSTYIRDIKLRCSNLVQYKIWDGIEIEDLNLWWKNFENDEEQYFAASILDSLIYRSEKQVGAMIFELFSRKIPNVLRQAGRHEYDLIDKLWNNNVDPKIRITAPIFDKPGQSGHQILRVLKRKWVKERWIINPTEIITEISKGIDVFIVVDDFSGTGNQMKEFIVNNKINDLINDSKVTIIFVCLCLHQKAKQNLLKNFPQILITSADIINENYSCFDTLSDGLNTRDDCKAFYKKIMQRKKIIPRKDRLYGRGNLEIVYAFQHSIPNNSLSILYHDKNWNPLFRR